MIKFRINQNSLKDQEAFIHIICRIHKQMVVAILLVVAFMKVNLTVLLKLTTQTKVKISLNQ